MPAIWSAARFDVPPGGTHKLQEMAVVEARGATRVYVRYSINGSETGMQKGHHAIPRRALV
jgi:hypothetical protein